MRNRDSHVSQSAATAADACREASMRAGLGRGPARPARRSADHEHVVYLPLPARRLGAALLTGFELSLADMRQDGAEVLVLDDACLCDLAQLVEGRVGQLDPVVLDRQATIGIVDDGDPLAAQATADRV